MIILDYVVWVGNLVCVCRLNLGLVKVGLLIWWWCIRWWSVFCVNFYRYNINLFIVLELIKRSEKELKKIFFEGYGYWECCIDLLFVLMKVIVVFGSVMVEWVFIVVELICGLFFGILNGLLWMKLLLVWVCSDEFLLRICSCLLEFMFVCGYWYLIWILILGLGFSMWVVVWLEIFNVL